MSKRSAEGDPGEPGSEPPSKRMPGGEGGKDLQFLVSEVLCILLCPFTMYIVQCTSCEFSLIGTPKQAQAGFSKENS